MPTIHILNGDCLAEQLHQGGIPGERIICRECLIDGPLNGKSLADFWNTRAQFIAATYHDTPENYFRKVVTEFEKILHLPDHAEIHLWFEDDLFCQTNLWFILSLLAKQDLRNKQIFRVFPVVQNPADHWKGFSTSTAKALAQSLSNKTPINRQDLIFGQALWYAYQSGDHACLLKLSTTPTSCFSLLPEVCQAHADRFPPDGSLSRPEAAIQQLLETNPQDFKTIFTEFTRTQGIYGYGDLQIKALYDRLLNT